MSIAVTFIVCGAIAAEAQQPSEPPEDARVQLGPVVFAPSVSMTNIGYDSNIYGRDLSQGEQSDVTAKLTPAVSGWLRLPHVKLDASGAVTFNYFKTNTNLRSTDTAFAAGLWIPLGRLTPRLAGTLTDAHQSSSVEIDAMAQSRSADAVVGLAVEVTPSFTLDVYFRTLDLDYASENPPYFGVDLARTLNHSSRRVGFAVQDLLTPYTAFGIDVNQQRDEFDASASDSDNLEIKPFVEFSPSAVISGRATVGFKQRRFLVQQLGETSGTTADVNLNYTLLGHTRFTVEADRDLEYSYLALARQYLSTGLRVSALHRFNDAWDAAGTVGKANVAYRDSTTSAAAIVTPPDEHLRLIDGSIGYTLDKTRTSFVIEYRTRNVDSIAGSRTTRWVYRRLRLGANVTHEF